LKCDCCPHWRKNFADGGCFANTGYLNEAPQVPQTALGKPEPFLKILLLGMQELA